eukprot:scaffold28805_cov17-Prasinocladus_malaysianus.AAC.1
MAIQTKQHLIKSQANYSSLAGAAHEKVKRMHCYQRIMYSASTTQSGNERIDKCSSHIMM